MVFRYRFIFCHPTGSQSRDMIRVVLNDSVGDRRNAERRASDSSSCQWWRLASTPNDAVQVFVEVYGIFGVLGGVKSFLSVFGWPRRLRRKFHLRRLGPRSGGEPGLALALRGLGTHGPGVRPLHQGWRRLGERGAHLDATLAGHGRHRSPRAPFVSAEVRRKLMLARGGATLDGVECAFWPYVSVYSVIKPCYNLHDIVYLERGRHLYTVSGGLSCPARAGHGARGHAGHARPRRGRRRRRARDAGQVSGPSSRICSDTTASLSVRVLRVSALLYTSIQ